MSDNKFKKWWLLLIKGLILILFSVIIFFYPDLFFARNLKNLD